MFVCVVMDGEEEAEEGTVWWQFDGDDEEPEAIVFENSMLLCP